MISILIVDDSVTMRSIIKSVLRKQADIKVVGEASDPYEARDKIKALNPDVLLLDVEMPKMSGLDFLDKVMTLRPMPVIMLSGTTQRGAKDTITALGHGAFECLEKPKSGDFIRGLSELPDIIRAAAQYDPLRGKSSENISAPKRDPNSFKPDNSIIGIGASTGGVEALLNVLGMFPANCPPTIVTQHMPASFLESFADRLNRNVLPTVKPAEDNEVLKPGVVLLAPGGDSHLQVKGRSHFRCHLNMSDPVSGHRPSVDVMFSSMASAVKTRGIGVILTGLGRDGAKGLLSMREAGARTLGQDEASSIVYGMPKVAQNIGAVQQQYRLNNIGETLVEMSNSLLEKAS